MTTKELLKATSISEPSLRRWLHEKRIPELHDAPKDWRGWRTWGERHVQAILRYQERKLEAVR